MNSSIFSKRFDKPAANRASLVMDFSKILSCDQQVELELEVSKDEVKRAVWDCGTDKAHWSERFTLFLSSFLEGRNPFVPFFNGHDPNSKRTSWVKWKNVLASKEKGGLGVSSLYALNRGLMFKWVWRFFTQYSLWSEGLSGHPWRRWECGEASEVCFPSYWMDIVHEINVLNDQGWHKVDSIQFGLYLFESKNPWGGIERSSTKL
ncbi:hypothetical protein Tco_0467822 [Tanacetum coccineum]